MAQLLICDSRDRLLKCIKTVFEIFYNQILCTWIANLSPGNCERLHAMTWDVYANSLLGILTSRIGVSSVFCKNPQLCFIVYSMHTTVLGCGLGRFGTFTHTFGVFFGHETSWSGDCSVSFCPAAAVNIQKGEDQVCFITYSNPYRIKFCSLSSAMCIDT